jgi:hypothetical protein
MNEFQLYTYIFLPVVVVVVVAVPRSNIPARKLSVPGYSGDFMEAVFPTGIHRIFPLSFLSYPTGYG